MKILYYIFLVLFTLSLLFILVVFFEEGWDKWHKLLASAFSVTTLIGTVILRSEVKSKERY